jgi:hypothetical protein
MVVTTLLMFALTPLVSQMLATWARGSEVAGMIEFRGRGLGMLRDDLRHAVVSTALGRSDARLTFRGNETSMSFPAFSGLGEGRDGIEMLSITVTNSVDGRALIRRRAPVIGTTYSALVDPVVLFSGPYKYFLRYYSSEGAETSEWTDPMALPANVVVNIIDARGRLSSVPVAIPVLASISAACLAGGHLPGCPAMEPPAQEKNSDPLNFSVKQ